MFYKPPMEILIRGSKESIDLIEQKLIEAEREGFVKNADEKAIITFSSIGESKPGEIYDFVRVMAEPSTYSIRIAKGTSSKDVAALMDHLLSIAPESAFTLEAC